MNVLPQIDVSHKTDDELWYKDAIIYQLHVKSFADATGNGIGDFEGLTSRLDYLQDLGVTALWLMPFYPSPGKDDGYDIADYGDINPDFGTMKDFRRFMTEAKRRGLRVIIELVINHTSDQHAWFKRARRSAPGSSARDWYVWSDTDQKYPETRIIFTDTEKSNWTWDSEANAFYWHRFFSHQPDLNFDNPRVVRAVVQVMKRWLDAGVDGFRLDAVPYLCERDGTNNENLPATHAVIKHLRAELDAYAPGKVLLAEANQWPEDVQHYFGDGDECHMAYHFPLMPRIYMAIAQEDRFPIADILRQTPDIPPSCQWAMFLRNHDELTLEMVTDVERDYLWSTYATDPRARINLGIRRRLAPLMENDRRKIELMNALLLSLPGTPIIYYGDEIGMGDNIYLGDRNGVRTPMQWTPDRNGGFSRCDPARLYAPVIMDPVYGFQSVNVEAQSRNISSLLSWTKRLIGVRKSTRVFGRGSLAFVRPANRAVLVYLRQYENETILCVANMSRSAQSAEMDLSAWKGRVPQEMLGRSRFPRIGDAPYVVTLAPYGFFWFLLADEPDHTPEMRNGSQEFETLVIGDGWDALRDGRSARALERDVLPAFLNDRRWFGDKSRRLPMARLDATMPLQDSGLSVLLAIVAADGGRGEARYLLPLSIHWTRFGDLGPLATAAAAAVRRGPREGSLLDAGGEREFNELMLKAIHAGTALQDGNRRIEFHPTAAFRASPPPSIEKLCATDREQSNTTSIADNNYVIKLIRRLNAGTHPEIEVGRFLLETDFRNAPDLLGWAELVEGDRRSAIAVVHRFVENQGDAWTVSAAYLDRFIDEQRYLSGETAAGNAELASYLQRVQTIGVRTAEMGRTLASRSDLPDFAPEPITAADTAAWTQRLLANCNETFDMLRPRLDELPDYARPAVEAMLKQSDAIAGHVASLLPAEIGAPKVRHHGDFHLGQVLIAKDDVFILDFEGEPGRPLDQRREKAPAARDVAGLIRSIDYSATSALIRAGNLTDEERTALQPQLAIWRERAIDTFWSAVRSLPDDGLWPEDEDAAMRLLDFFLLEKAFYEIQYELNNRPNWLHVPLDGAWRILLRNGVVKP